MGVTPYNGQSGEALPKRGTFFRLEVYKRVGISRIEVYKQGLEGGVWIPNHELIFRKFPNHVACSRYFPNHVSTTRIWFADRFSQPE